MRLFSISLLFSAYSCITTKCPLCNLDNQTIYNIEIKDSVQEKYQRSRFSTFFSPIPLQGTGKKYELHIVDCDGAEAFRLLDGEEKATFIKNNIVIVDTLDIERITKNSDSDFLPVHFTVDKLLKENGTPEDFQFCERTRNALKIELRCMLAARLNTAPYIPVPGATPIEKKLFAFGEEGTILTFGPEVAILPTVWTVKNKHRLNVGLLTGYWPVDGGNYIPLAIHPRFTFNDVSSPLSGQCNAWYIFGDIGTAYDLTGSFEKFWSKTSGFNSAFYDLGFGFDLWQTKNMDLSFDMGFRNTTLALTRGDAEQELLECLSENNIQYSAYSRRRVGQLFIRVGVTF